MQDRVSRFELEQIWAEGSGHVSVRIEQTLVLIEGKELSKDAIAFLMTPAFQHEFSDDVSFDAGDEEFRRAFEFVNFIEKLHVENRAMEPRLPFELNRVSSDTTMGFGLFSQRRFADEMTVRNDILDDSFEDIVSAANGKAAK